MRRFLTGIDAALQKIINVATGTAPNDAVNVAQLQSALAGLSWHGAVRAASTTNVSLTAPGAALDGVTLAAGNRDGVTGTLNAGAALYVDEGTVNADTAWTLATDDPIPSFGSSAKCAARVKAAGCAIPNIRAVLG